MGMGHMKSKILNVKLQSFEIFYQWTAYRTMILISQNKLLKKAEKLADKDFRVLACTFNNYGCLFRKTKKLRSALTFLLKALEIEYKQLNESEVAVDDQLVTSNP